MNEIIINRSDLYGVYPSIGKGAEGTVFNYDDEHAIKLFKSQYFTYNEEELAKKEKKIKLLGEFKDENFCFPLGIVRVKNNSLFGYYMKLIHRKKRCGSFESLFYFDDFDTILDICIKADAAIERIHKEGIIIGDIAKNNILIDSDGRPIFIDTDNFAYKDCPIDLGAESLDSLTRIYGKKYSPQANDRFLFALLAMQVLTKSQLFHYQQSREMLDLLIDDLQIDPGIVADLKVIFSDSSDKPHIGPILKKVKDKNIRF
jgi:serine/threonine protein kinase